MFFSSESTFDEVRGTNKNKKLQRLLQFFIFYSVLKRSLMPPMEPKRFVAS